MNYFLPLDILRGADTPVMPMLVMFATWCAFCVAYISFLALTAFANIRTTIICAQIYIASDP